MSLWITLWKVWISRCCDMKNVLPVIFILSKFAGPIAKCLQNDRIVREDKRFGQQLTDSLTGVHSRVWITSHNCAVCWLRVAQEVHRRITFL